MSIELVGKVPADLVHCDAHFPTIVRYVYSRFSIGVALIAILMGGCAPFVAKSVAPFESGIPGYSAESLAPGKFRVAYFSYASSSDASAQRQFANFAKRLCPAGYDTENIKEVLTVGTSHDPPDVGLGFKGILLCRSEPENTLAKPPTRSD